MSIDIKTINKISTLAKLKINEEKAYELETELSNILDWIDQLNQVDTSGVEPLTGVVKASLFQREDLINEDNKKDLVLKNSPETAEGFFVVPKVVD